MLRTLFTRSMLKIAGATLWAGSALACTGADEVDMTPTARMSPTIGLGNAEGLKLRMRQQDTVLSAYLPPPSLTAMNGMTAMNARADGEPRRSTERERATASTLTPHTPVLAAADDSADAHAYKPMAMLAAALALMVSIALRRSGKR